MVVRWVYIEVTIEMATISMNKDCNYFQGQKLR
jgi:hypothetical protein